ncbi:WhiB family transcriptional regulator [Mycolicibacterium komossense]|uniref:Transcriptional regulator WhiB n=1 Tax=Mycolicibacterium komossense TaxID=1779 RepID=A0ABT3C7R2_9MYCO|nr:WhiB family transcriptional regulator [Mycolicibacterium komossense]MCV7225524.1 WhiB family transcriptional regulator [Mycolicibacterium komossense]
MGHSLALADTRVDGDYWHPQARCRRTSAEYFFAPENERRDIRLRREQLAKQICRACPVLLLCRSYAVDARESYGIWGATTPRERQRLAADQSGRLNGEQRG